MRDALRRRELLETNGRLLRLHGSLAGQEKTTSAGAEVPGKSRAICDCSADEHAGFSAFELG